MSSFNENVRPSKVRRRSTYLILKVEEQMSGLYMINAGGHVCFAGCLLLGFSLIIICGHGCRTWNLYYKKQATGWPDIFKQIVKTQPKITTESNSMS